ncbi:hypothetical protein ACA910_006171 [Epithemia clementina (nom. ined.)]
MEEKQIDDHEGIGEQQRERRGQHLVRNNKTVDASRRKIEEKKTDHHEEIREREREPRGQRNVLRNNETTLSKKIIKEKSNQEEIGGRERRQSVRNKTTVALDQDDDDVMVMDDFNQEQLGLLEELNPEEDAPLLLVVKEWAQTSTMHGVRFIAASDIWKRWKRGLWFLLVIGAGALMVWQIETLIQQYLDYDVITETETINPPSLPFPEVTVCSTNLFSQQALDKYDITDPANETELWLVANANIILRTWFNNVEILESNSTTTTTGWRPRITDKGICYSFQTDQEVFRPGVFGGGLEFYVNLNQDDFRPQTELAGIVVFVQQPGTPIHDQLPFAVMAPGKEAVATLDVTEWNRERQAPWARCFSAAPNYTQPLCHSQCLHEKMRHDCGCRSYGGDKDPDLRYCQPNERPPDALCAQNISENQKEVFETFCNHCSLPPCSQTTYRMVTSELDFSQVLYSKLLENMNLTETELLQNFMVVRLNYGSIQMDRLSETKAMTQQQLIGNIGGSMGLYLGISALSMFEIFGDFMCLRLIPRLFGYRHLYGLGAQSSSSN